MSVRSTAVTCVFGKVSDAPGRAYNGSAAQTKAEVISATTSRVIKGPQKGGHLSYHLIVGAGSGGPAGALTVWYSNLPNPDPTVDAHWVQDTSIAPVDLAVVANTFINVGNVFAEHIRFKATRTAGNLDVVLWARIEGASV